MGDPKDYTHRGWISMAALIVVLLLLSLIPPVTVGGVKLRRANILSDVVRFEDAALTDDRDLIDDDEFRIDFSQVARQLADTALSPVVAEVYLWDACAAEPADGSALDRNTLALASERRAVPEVPIDGASPARVEDGSAALSGLRRAVADPAPPADRETASAGAAVPIEDFDTTGCSPFRAFCRKLLDGQAAVRIAVLGDSFIEGDILSSDLRELLQTAFGGRGAGFAPIASPLTGFRRTIRTHSRGWESYNIMQRRSTPSPYRDNHFVSGWVCRPQAGASVRWECSDAFSRLDSCGVARILFSCSDKCRLRITLNNSESELFDIEGDPAVRQIEVRGSIHSLGMEVLAGATGMIGYGAIFEDGKGVSVDNYSVRSNNGQALLWTNPAVNARIDALGSYDLVVLQYGLNMLQSGVRSYDRYGEQIEKIVAYVRQCFPSAGVLVLGVSDRSVRSERGFEPMDSAPVMTASQRRAAQRTGAAFWSTYDAMQSLGGMARFVADGWAGKDYTHINFNGGRKIAECLYESIRQAVLNERSQPIVPPRQEPLLDSLRHRAILSGMQRICAPRPPRQA